MKKDKKLKKQHRVRKCETFSIPWRNEALRRSQTSTLLSQFNPKGSTKSKQEISLIIGGKKYTGVEARYLKDYIQAITSKHKRPFSLKYFNKSVDASTIDDYTYEIGKARFLTDIKNRDALITINDYWLRMHFGASRLYGLPNSFKIYDIPNNEPTHSDENFVFIHGDEYFDALVDAPKYFIENWQKRVDNCQVTIKTRKCLMKINGEIILGEFCKETQKGFDSVAQGSKSGIKFSVYYQGKPDGKFTVDRWDYLPLSEHRNKFTEDGEFCHYGTIVPKTQLSHRHASRLLSRLVLTQNQSPDIEPTLINSLGFENEIAYDDFQDMCGWAEMFWNVQPGMIPIHELPNRSLTKMGKVHCMEYDKQLHTDIRHKELAHTITYERKKFLKFLEQPDPETYMATVKNFTIDKTMLNSQTEFTLLPTSISSMEMLIEEKIYSKLDKHNKNEKDKKKKSEQNEDQEEDEKEC